MPISAQARSIYHALAPLLGLLSVYGFFALTTPGFLSFENQKLMLLQTTVVGVAAIGATAIIISGGLDLSVGSTIALGTVVIALLLKGGVPPLVAALGGVATGVACGLLIGTLVVGRWALSPFIVTLAMWGALRGLAKGLGNNQPIYPDTEATGWLPTIMNGTETGAFSVVPPCIVILFLVAGAMAFILRCTVLGRRLYAIGGNEHAARTCGVPVDRTKLAVYGMGVGCAGLASVLQFGYLTVGDPTTASGYELKVIAAVVIGGASLSGGVGKVSGTLIGALIMTVVDTGCTKMQLDNWVQDIVTGAIILAAVGLDRWRASRR